MNTSRRRILAFPFAGNIYTEMLYAEVQRRGVEVIEGTWLTGWLVRHVRRDDLIHIHWPSFLYAVPGSNLRTAVRLARLFGLLAFAKARGAAIVWTAHNLYPHDGGGTRWSDRLGRRIIVAYADPVIVHGPSAADLVSREFGIPPSRLRVGHHPHWIDLYPNTIGRASSRARLGVGEEDYLYLYVGRCRPYKGLESLIAAFAQIPGPARLLIAGSFSSPEFLETIRGLAQSTARVTLEPRSIPDDELQIYLNAADCVVMPYRAVLTSGTAMLALSFGRPVVAPNLGAIRDHVGADGGVLYNPEESGALTDALGRIRSLHVDEATLLRRAREFTWGRLADLLLDVTA